MKLTHQIMHRQSPLLVKLNKVCKDSNEALIQCVLVAQTEVFPKMEITEER